MISAGKSNVLLVFIILIAAGAAFLVLGHPCDPNETLPGEPCQAPSNIVGIAGPQNTDPKEQNLQIKSLPVYSPTPTPSPVPTPGINFSSPFLDWEDVQIAITTNSSMCAYIHSNPAFTGMPYCQWDCPTLSQKCGSQLEDTVTDEVGNLASGSYGPASRVALCLGDASCRQSGYTQYKGSTPLPNRVPDKDCQDQIKQCYEQSPESAQVSSLNCNDPYNGACDPSDGICGYLAGLSCVRY